MLKFVRQTVRLGVLWMAICTSLAGTLVYTKSSLEILLADYIAAEAQSKPGAATSQRTRTQ